MASLAIKLLPQHFAAIAPKLEAAVLRPTAVHASQRIAQRAIGTYMRDVGPGAGRRSPTDMGPLRIIKGTAAKSLTGGAGSPHVINRVDVSGGVLTLTKGSTAPGIVHNERRKAKSGVPLATITPALEDELQGISDFAARKLGDLVGSTLAGGAQ